MKKSEKNVCLSSGEGPLGKRTASVIKRLALLPVAVVALASCSQGGGLDINYKSDANSIYVYYSENFSKHWFANEYDWLGYNESNDRITIKAVKNSKTDVCRYANCQWEICYK